jgi:S-(hydroxymethyl)glutathione dehydrogenase/alcohol dehydrogenase
MKAAMLFEPKTAMSIEEVEIDLPQDNEVLIRVGGSGLCHSDLHYMNGDLPFNGPAVFGHEVAGVVERVGREVSTVQVGDHVVACASGFCGHCTSCVSGKSHLCTDKPKRDPQAAPRLSWRGKPVLQGTAIGGFAEMVLLHENWVVPVDRDVPLDRAALLGCGVLTGLGSVFNTAQVRPGTKVVVVGCGGVGLNVVQGARIAGAAQIVAVDLAPEKLELARRLGATHVAPGGPDAVEAVLELTRGGGDYVFEVIGLAATIAQAFDMVRRGGQLTMVGASRPDMTLPFSAFKIVANEMRIQGAVMGSSPFVRDIPRFASMYLAGQLDLDSLVAERIRLEDINTAFDVMKTGAQARSIITFCNECMLGRS